MHRYLRAVGFSGLKNRRDEDWLMEKIEKQFNTSRKYIAKDGEEQVVLDVKLGKGIGVKLRGSWREDGAFRREFYYPYIEGAMISSHVPCQVERHAERAEYSGFLDDMRRGFMLIFSVQNGLEFEQRTGAGDLTFQIGGVKLSALSTRGTIMIPMYKTEEQIEVVKTMAAAKEALIEAARQGDEQAMEALSITEYNEVQAIAERVATEDIYSIVDTTLMPCGVESDHYSILGNITALRSTINRWTKEAVHVITVECNDVSFDVAINAKDLRGEPAVGRRFKGEVWLQGKLELLDDSQLADMNSLFGENGPFGPNGFFGPGGPFGAGGPLSPGNQGGPEPIL